MYPIAMHFAKSAAANALVEGLKSVELCQAYILMSNYDVPTRRLDEDRSWLYTGFAIRCARPFQSTTHVLLRSNAAAQFQNCDRPGSASPVAEETGNGTARTGDVEPRANMDQLL
jgi:hypothetical protein